MILICYILGAVMLGALLLYASLEIHYFLRMLLAFTFTLCKRKAHILDTLTTTGICLTTDIDLLLLHMNNARYIRELDFAKFDFFKRTGLFRKIKSKGGAMVQGASTIRYRKFIRPFTIYRIKSKILYWDDQNIYMEHRFITPKDNFIRAIAIGRQRVIKCNANDIMRELMTKDGKSPEDIHKPQLPLEVAKWIECNEISSSNLRNGL
ncbi:UNVERIFIED_CONTAM: hypothetical protein PYX00_010785 [Menopon gallinae]|uniref:Protein THEM6 n=1 Tax=Menopon gallinae TaxID=328185 RepID=A0AAW2HGW1_9NEOP